MSTPSAPPRWPLAGPGGAWQKVKGILGIGSLGDWLFKHICQAAAALVIVVVVLIVIILAVQAWPAIEHVGLSIITDDTWDPTNAEKPRYGGLVFIYGSVVTSALAMLIAVPLGVGTAAFLAEIATGTLKRVGSFLVELLAAIPSVVYGFWGLSVLAPAMLRLFNALPRSTNKSGLGLISASLVLAVMVVPYIAAVSYDACQAVPRSQREGAFALGSTRWQTIWRVVLPYARPGILGGCFLALGRAIGETMAVTMLIGGANRYEPLPFGQGQTIPTIIATDLPGCLLRMHRAALINLGLLLFAVTVAMNVIARVLIWRVGRTGRGPSVWARLRRRHRAAAEVVSAQPEPPGAAPVAPRTAAQVRRARRIDRLMTGVLALCLVVTCGPLFLILGYITVQGVGALNLDFFTELPQPQGEEGGGLANGLVGSGIIVGLASLMALPVGLLAAIFLAEYRASRLAPVVRFFGELLGGVPSIVIGTFVYALVRWFIDHKYLANPLSQFSGWAGAFALAVMMLPIVMRASEEAIKMVPQSLRNASHALGAFHWQTVVRVCVPAALPAIITGAFLAIARIAGETAPLLLTVLGSDRMVFSPQETMGALPLYIYLYSTSAFPAAQQKAWAAAMVLLTFIMLLNVGVRLLTGKRVILASRAD
jgi:phosphate transport system permease protein